MVRGRVRCSKVYMYLGICVVYYTKTLTMGMQKSIIS